MTNVKVDLSLIFTESEMLEYLKEKGLDTNSLTFDINRRVFEMYARGSINKYLKNIVLNEKSFVRDEKLDKILE